MKSSSPGIVLTGSLFLAVAVLSGCQTSSLSKLKPTLPNSITKLWGVDNSMRWADKDNPAVRCVCLWQPADGTWEGRPTRGFGGQVFFLDRKTARPIAVNGDVRIHVFDNVGPRENHGKAVHTFDFTKGAWNAFLVKTQFGPAYNVFIPYTRPGHHKTEGAVRVRLADEGMPTVFSDMSYVKLDGAKLEKGDKDKGLAGATKREQPTPSVTADSIGQISRRNGVTQASVNTLDRKQQPPVHQPRPGLSPELEARLKKLQKAMPVKNHDPRQTTDVEETTRASLPNSDSVPRSGDQETGSPRRFAAPSSASPIRPETRPTATPAGGSHPLDANSKSRSTHSLAPAHPLDQLDRPDQPAQPSADTTPIQTPHPTAANTAAGQGAWAGASTPGQGSTHSYDRMIRQAEAAAAGRDFSQAIRLASKVDRAVRRDELSWPLDQPTPSALVAEWEVQRIEFAAEGNSAQRTARIDSRVDDYLNASQAQLDKEQTAEAQRLATVAHLISRSTIDSDRAHPTPVSGQGAVVPAAAVEFHSSPTTRSRPAVSAGYESFQPTQPARSPHPLEAVGGGE